MDIPVSKDFKYDVFNIGDKRISLFDSYGRDFKEYWRQNKKFESKINNNLLMTKYADHDARLFLVERWLCAKWPSSMSERSMQKEGRNPIW